MRKSHVFFIVACFACAVTVLSSCNNEYDLSKDINTNVNVGKNFILPVGQTVQIPLSRIIKESDDLTTNASGIYELGADGSFNSHITDVATFNINGMQPEFIDFTFDDLPQYNLNQDISLTLPVAITSNATYEVLDTKTELPVEVDALYLAEFNNGNGAVSHITISIPSNVNGSNGIKEAVLSDITITFPEIITLQDGTHEIKRQNIVLNNENNYSIDIELNIINIQISPEEQSKYISEENGKKFFSLHESIYFEAKSTTITVNPSKVTNKQLHFQFGYSIAATTITRVNGIVTPDITINESLELTSLPNFIKDKTSSFTPNDLTFAVSLTNPVEMALETTLSITPWDNTTNSAIGNSVNIELYGNNAVKPSTTTNYLISNKPCEVPAGTINIVNENLVNLLATIPDCYKIKTNKITADGTNANGFTLGQNYNIEGNYEVNVPFSFKNITINYTDSIDGLKEDLEDVADLTNKIIIYADAISTIPAELEASVELYDSYGNKLNDIKVTGSSANTVKINAHDPKNGEETITPITLTIEEAEGSTQLEQLEKLVYTIKAKNTFENIVLKSNQYLVLKNGIAKVPNGITTEL